jgi:hypothetical protein
MPLHQLSLKQPNSPVPELAEGQFQILSLVVIKITIYRIGNDIKVGVIPRYEESPAVQLNG